MRKSVQYVYQSHNLLKINMWCQRSISNENRKINRRRPRSTKYAELSHFTLFAEYG